MRLIDADEFNEFISNHMDFLMPNNTEKVTQEEIHKFIHNQPTAYDIDKVVEELKNQIPFCPTNSFTEGSRKCFVRCNRDSKEWV